MFNKMKSINAFIFIIAVSLYIVVPFNLQMIHSLPINEFISDVFVTFNLVFIILFISNFIHQYVFKVIAIIFVIISSMSCYYQIYYNIHMELNIIIAMFNTTSREASEFLNYQSLLFFTFFTIIPSLYILLVKLNNNSFKCKIKYTAIFVILVIINVLIMNLFYHRNLHMDRKTKLHIFISNTFPVELSFNPSGFVVYLIKYIKLQSGKFTYKDLITNQTYKLKKQSQPLVTILVIGETSRADHYSLGGYNRNTNPLLSKEKNLVFFNNTISCYTGTIPSVSCLLEDTKGEKFRSDLPYYLKNEVGSFFPIFNKLNFNTYFASTSSYRPGDPIFQRFKDAKNIYYPSANKYSEQVTDLMLLTNVDDILKQTQKSKNNTLIVLHTIGSHFKYRSRYYAEQRKWLPICTEHTDDPSECNQKELFNDYDNSLLLTDKLLGTIINKIRNKNAVLIYTADHGENLGELVHGVKTYYHGGEFNKVAHHEINVPMIVWFSNQYLKENGKSVVQNAKKNSHKNINHDYIFHSILDCSGISNNKIIDKNLSLCKFK